MAVILRMLSDRSVEAGAVEEMPPTTQLIIACTHQGMLCALSTTAGAVSTLLEMQRKMSPAEVDAMRKRILGAVRRVNFEDAISGLLSVQAKKDFDSDLVCLAVMDAARSGSLTVVQPPCDPRVCAACGRVEKLKQCANCLSAFYCGPECQKQHWAVHKRLCKLAPGRAPTADGDKMLSRLVRGKDPLGRKK